MLYLLFSLPIASIIIITNYNIINKEPTMVIKSIVLSLALAAFTGSIFMWLLFDFSSNQFQFVSNSNSIGYFGLNFGIDGLSIYFVLLSAMIIPIALLSN
jgi:NADH-ubiquinone oxidoreductase chain 4